MIKVVQVLLLFFICSAFADGEEPVRRYQHRLKVVAAPAPILADHPEYVLPVQEVPEGRFEAPPLIEDEGATLAVKCWRFSYNARGIIEMTNHLDGEKTAIVVVHPWGVDDGSGWITPERPGRRFSVRLERIGL